MDFELSAEHQAIRETARRFVDKELPRTRILEWVRAKQEPPRELFRKLGELGMYGFLMPPEYSGMDRTDPMGMIVFVEQLARASSALTTAYGRAAVILGPLVANFANKQQKDMVLPKIIAGETFMALGLTEPGSGSDAASLKTRAVKQADGSYVINGEKMWPSAAGIADLYCFVCTTDPKLKEDGLALIYVPKDTPGLSFGKPENKMGMKISDVNAAIYLNNVRVPKSYRAGGPGVDWRMWETDIFSCRIRPIPCPPHSWTTETPWVSA